MHVLSHNTAKPHHLSGKSTLVPDVLVKLPIKPRTNI
jgi:hypothetical protein